MKKEKIAVVLTCYNRKEKTVNAIKKVNSSKKDVFFVIVDDASTDGTVEAINQLEDVKKKIIVGEGQLFYSRGMKRGMEFLLNSKMKFDYILIINDDVDFYDNFLENMCNFSKKNNNSVVIGATQGSKGELSYGGIKYSKKFLSVVYETIGPHYNQECDTFNANCVLIPYNYFQHCGSMDRHYIHSFGDFDYGFMLKRAGYKMLVYNEYIGICNRNSKENTWLDNKLCFWERMKKKESPKGLPIKQNYYYYKKNFNLLLAVRYSITPYIKILFKK